MAPMRSLPETAGRTSNHSLVSTVSDRYITVRRAVHAEMKVSVVVEIPDGIRIFIRVVPICL
jgi:hypothetical protein